MASPFDEFVTLSSAPSRLRVWWQDAATWRVDRMEPPGGEALYHEGDSTISWDAESLEATRTEDGLALIPGTVDLLPPRLAAWSLDGVDTDDIRRLPPSRVAGIEAAGLRIIPAGGQATVQRVDVWADPDTGLPLRVQIWGTGAVLAADTRFVDVEFARPPEDVTTFRPPQGVFLAAGGSGLIGHIPGVYRSISLAGLPLMPQHATEPITRYGRGLTQLLVIALDDSAAEPLRARLGAHPAAVVDRRGTWLSTGPLHLLLTPCLGHTASWLLAGTVDDDTLRRALRDVRDKTWEVSPTERSC
jgi:outer membrane lipoprotein-sorting protein